MQSFSATRRPLCIRSFAFFLFLPPQTFLARLELLKKCSQVVNYFFSPKNLPLPPHIVSASDSILMVHVFTYFHDISPQMTEWQSKGKGKIANIGWILFRYSPPSGTYLSLTSHSMDGALACLPTHSVHCASVQYSLQCTVENLPVCSAVCCVQCAVETLSQEESDH